MKRFLGSNTKSYSSLLVRAWKAFPNEPFLLLGSQGFSRLCAGSREPVLGPVHVHLLCVSSQRHTAGNQAAVRPTLQSGTRLRLLLLLLHGSTAPPQASPSLELEPPINPTEEAPGTRPIGSCTRVRGQGQGQGQGSPSLERDSFVRRAGCFLIPPTGLLDLCAGKEWTLPPGHCPKLGQEAVLSKLSPVASPGP